MSYNVFVYGSLLRGFGNHRLLLNSPYVEFVDEDSIKGSLYDCGYFPFVRHDNDGGNVVGEVYEVDINTLRNLDRLEGYTEGYEDDNLYNRKVITTNKGLEVFYYEGADFLLSGSSPKIESGDWREYCGAHPN